MEVRIGFVEFEKKWSTLILEQIKNFKRGFYFKKIDLNQIELSKLLYKDKFDIVLISIDQTLDSREDAFKLIETFKLAKCKVIVLTDSSNEKLIIRSLIAGAVNIINIQNSSFLIHAIILATSEFDPMLVLVEHFAQLLRQQTLSKLSAAEREVFDLLEQGCAINKIHKRLFKSSNTVKNQINNILKKLNATNSKEAIKIVNGTVSNKYY